MSEVSTASKSCDGRARYGSWKRSYRDSKKLHRTWIIKKKNC